MAIVAGVDFGTLSVRVSIVDSERGMLASAIAEYPLHRKREDPEYAGQVRTTMFIGIGLIEALALFGIAFSFII